MPSGPGLYSRLVAVLKVGLPLIALAMLAGLFLISEDRRPGGELVFSEADLKALGEGLRVTGPVFSGMTEANDRFRFTAAAVVPDAAPPTRAEIDTLSGRIDLANGLGIDLSAERGAIDLATQVMDLAGSVRVVTTDGYDFAADTVSVDLAGGGLEAQGAVAGSGPMGDIVADALSVSPPSEDGGGRGGARRFHFKDNVRLLYHPPVEGE